MLSLTKNAFASLVVLLAVPTATAQFPPVDLNADNLIPQWFPQCFDGLEAVNPFDVVDCIRENSQPACLEKNVQETIMDVVQCVNVSISDEVTDFINSFATQEEPTATSRQGGNPLEDFLNDVIGIDSEGLFNIGRVFVNATLECLDPYADCVNQTIQEAMNTRLDPCINETLRELLECGRENNATCLDTCSNMTPMETLPFEGLNFQAVQTCGGIQTNLMNPLCEVVSCCEPCVAKMEALMQCIVNDQLDQVPTVGETCEDLTCPSVPERKLRATTSIVSRGRVLEEGEHRKEENCLQYSPGLTGDDGEEFSARSAIFLPCVSDSFLGAVKTAAVQENDTDESSAGFRAGSISLAVMVAVASLAV